MKLAEVKEVMLDLYYSTKHVLPNSRQDVAIKKVLDILDKLQAIAERRGLDI